MNAGALIQEAQARGVELWADGGMLRYRGDPVAVQALRLRLKVHKPALLALLAGKPAAFAKEPAAPPAGADPGPILPPPWDAIRDRIAQGWRAEFGPPGPDGRQPLRWIPPGAWKAGEPHQGEPVHQGTSGATSWPVCCGDCQHFTADTIGDGSGIGSCLAGVPARPGFPARYPKAERYCREFAPVTGEARA